METECRHRIHSAARRKNSHSNVRSVCVPTSQEISVGCVAPEVNKQDRFRSDFNYFPNARPCHSQPSVKSYALTWPFREGVVIDKVGEEALIIIQGLRNTAIPLLLL